LIKISKTKMLYRQFQQVKDLDRHLVAVFFIIACGCLLCKPQLQALIKNCRQVAHRGLKLFGTDYSNIYPVLFPASVQRHLKQPFKKMLYGQFQQVKDLDRPPSGSFLLCAHKKLPLGGLPRPQTFRSRI